MMMMPEEHGVVGKTEYHGVVVKTEGHEVVVMVGVVVMVWTM